MIFEEVGAEDENIKMCVLTALSRSWGRYRNRTEKPPSDSV